MSLPKVASRDEWLAARKALLEEEKAMTRARDALNVKRRELPMVKIDKDYAFEGPDGNVGLVDLFEGRRQLIIQHFMFDPSWDDGCPSCTAAADEMSDGLRRHLAARDTAANVVLRACRCESRPSDISSAAAEQLGQPSSHDGSNMKCWTTSCRSPSNSSARPTFPSGPSNE